MNPIVLVQTITALAPVIEEAVKLLETAINGQDVQKFVADIQSLTQKLQGAIEQHKSQQAQK